MNPGLAILVCLLIIGPLLCWGAWKFFTPWAQEMVSSVEEGQRRRAAGEAPVTTAEV